MVLAWRFSVWAATLGFVAGLGEAAFLWLKPQPTVFLRTDVHYVIWFIAPIVGALSLGIVGLGLGVVALAVRRIHPWLVLPAAATGSGLAAVYTAACLRVLHAGGGNPFRALTQGPAWICFLAGFAMGFVALTARTRSTQLFEESNSPPPPKSLARILALMVGFALAGLLVAHGSRSAPWTLRSRAETPPRSSSPNIVLITLDTVRADHLSAYGYALATSPNFDRMAQQGVLFENAIAPSSWTLASHASIFTELLPHQHGANLAAPLEPGPQTIASILQGRGYETAGFSNNLSYGFAGWGMSHGFNVYNDDGSSVRHNFAKTLVGRDVIHPMYQRLAYFDDFDRRNAEELNRDVLRWWGRRPARPFFLFINYYDAHLSYVAPEPFNHRFGTPPQGLVRRIFESEDGRLGEPLSPQDQQAHIASYDNCLAYLDDQLGRLVRVLAASPDWSNTVVMITSDHGEAFGEHGRYGHGWDLYREVLHVPLIVFGPGILSGLRVPHPVEIRQLFATALDFALPGPEPVRDSSLRRFWMPGAGSQPHDDAVVSELDESIAKGGTVSISLMTPEWHFIQEANGRAELYRWPNDPGERVNLAESSEHQSVVQQLSSRLNSSVENSLPPWRGPEYLLALDRPGYFFARQALFRPRGQASLPSPYLRLGATQAYFSRNTPTRLRRFRPIDEELLKSLPYH